MRKFKLFFYPIYLITAFTVLYFSFDFLVNMDAYKENIHPFEDLKYYTTTIPTYALSGFIFLVVLMLVELIAENIQIINLKRRVKKAEEETMRYKAKLYDRTEEETNRLMIPEEEDNDEDDDD